MRCAPQNSNVVQFLAMLKKDNNNEQLVYYQVDAPSTPHYIADVNRVIRLALARMRIPYTSCT